ncbi:MAG: hypothetical protein C0625_00360 [Arcobacter sp.]|nr:MAG: hypothetical protein C0625_00360 [Arcobacter sp.]
MVIAQTPDTYVKAPKPVSYVDAEKFSGLWYEIARTYNSFEKNCVGATVEYKLTKPLTYEIKNRCFDTSFGGKTIEYNGTAKPSNGNVMSQIDMTYFWIFTKEYRVIYLEEDYSSAVLVDKDMEYVWIMNREPFMKKKKLDTIVASLENHMDTSKLIYTPQEEQGQKNEK